jgi:GWxTD domain-containing protein
MNLKKAFSFLLIVLVFFGCFIPGKSLKTAEKKFNSNDAPVIRAKFFVYHVDEKTTELFFRISTSSLLYMRQNSNDNFVSNIKLNYKLSDKIVSKVVSDSASFLIHDTVIDKKGDFIEGKFSVNCLYGKNNELEIMLTDINRKSSFPFFVSIQKEKKSQRQNFFVAKASAPSSPLYNYNCNVGDLLNIHFDKDSSLERIQVRFYKREFGLPLPPFATQEQKAFDYKADSVFTIYLDKNFNSKLPIISNGFYHLVTDTQSTIGLTVFCNNDYFPQNNVPNLMYKPMRYVTTKQEFAEIENSKILKDAIDSYWLKCSGSKERARQVIKVFYNRTYLSNEYFSSYDMGWKTDRGLIYIVFGSPTNIYKDNVSEVWVYGEDNSVRSLNFTFTKVINPFSDNDYSLNRSEAYKDSWYRVVEGWRQGRLINEK